MKDLYSIEKDKLGGFEYPPLFFKMIELDLLDFDLWFVLNAEMSEKIMIGLRKRYPSRCLIPFAKKTDNDDIACFEVQKGERIQIIHDYSSVGYEQRGEFDSLGKWLIYAVQEFVRFNTDE